MAREQKPLFIDWCPKDALDGMIQMSPQKELAYRRVLDLIAVTNNALEDNDERLGQLTKVGTKRWRKFRAELIRDAKLYLAIEGQFTFVRNERMDRTLAAARSRIAKASSAGKASAESRKSLRNNETGAASVVPQAPTPKATRDATPGQPTIHPTTQEESEANASDRRKRRQAKQATALPSDWVPNERNLTDAKARGYQPARVRELAEHFRDHHLAKGTLSQDWDASWRTWLANDKRFSAERAGRSQPHGNRQSPGSVFAAVGENIETRGLGEPGNAGIRMGGHANGRDVDEGLTGGGQVGGDSDGGTIFDADGFRGVPEGARAS